MGSASPTDLELAAFQVAAIEPIAETAKSIRGLELALAVARDDQTPHLRALLRGAQLAVDVTANGIDARKL